MSISAKRPLTIGKSGKDPKDALSCRPLSAKRPLINGLCGKWSIKIRHPIGLGHPVQPIAFGASSDLNLCPQFHRSFFTEPWQKTSREWDQGMRLETQEMTLKCNMSLFTEGWQKRPREWDQRMRLKTQEMTLHFRVIFWIKAQEWRNRLEMPQIPRFAHS